MQSADKTRPACATDPIASSFQKRKKNTRNTEQHASHLFRLRISLCRNFLLLIINQLFFCSDVAVYRVGHGLRFVKTTNENEARVDAVELLCFENEEEIMERWFKTNFRLWDGWEASVGARMSSVANTEGVCEIRGQIQKRAPRWPAYDTNTSTKRHGASRMLFQASYKIFWATASSFSTFYQNWKGVGQWGNQINTCSLKTSWLFSLLFLLLLLGRFSIHNIMWGLKTFNTKKGDEEKSNKSFLGALFR